MSYVVFTHEPQRIKDALGKVTIIPHQFEGQLFKIVCKSGNLILLEHVPRLGSEQENPERFFVNSQEHLEKVSDEFAQFLMESEPYPKRDNPLESLDEFLNEAAFFAPKPLTDEESSKFTGE